MALKRWRDISIWSKLFTLMLAVGILPILILGIGSILRSKWALENAAINQLISIRSMKKNQIENVFEHMRSQVITFSEDLMVVDAMGEFTQAFETLGEKPCEYYVQNKENLDAQLREQYEYQQRNTLEAPEDALDQWYPREHVTCILQSLYIAENTYPSKEKKKLAAAPDDSLYTQFHKKYHLIFRDIMEKFDYHDVYLIEPESGYIVYSVMKEVDYATTLKNGPYRDSNFAHVLNKALETENKDAAFITDYEQYTPSYDTPTAFLASPIYDGEDKIGVLAFQISTKKINQIMTDHQSWRDVGLGETGESYIIAQDTSMRNDSRFFLENKEGFLQNLERRNSSRKTIERIQKTNTTILFQNVRTEGAEAAVQGEPGEKVYTNYRGHQVIGAFAPVNIPGLDWYIMAEIEQSEAFLPATQLVRSIGFNLLVVLVIVFFFGLPIIRNIARSIRKVTSELCSLSSSEADLTIRIPDESNDEVGRLAKSFNQLMEKLSDLVKQVQNSGVQVTSSSTQIAASSRELEASVSEQASSTNEVVATAKEISTTSQELSHTMNDSTQVASQLGTLANHGQDSIHQIENTMQQLRSATQSISSKLSTINDKAGNINSVVTTITKVADQTNLLSLNAAIEAEKAGEYGLGFSVVAREIRRLADQSAVATLDIEQMVNEMQSAVSAGVMEMDKFSKEVTNGVEVVNSLSSNLEMFIDQVQQLTPRFESVNEGMHSQSEGAKQISESMIQLNEGAQQVAESLRELNEAIEQLNEAAHGMQDEVAKFKVT